jgi:hypothetical protein
MTFINCGPDTTSLEFTPCSLGLSATSQQYFSLTTNQPLETSQQYSSLRTNQHQPSATSQPNRLLVHNFSKRSNGFPFYNKKLSQHGRKGCFDLHALDQSSFPRPNYFGRKQNPSTQRN